MRHGAHDLTRLLVLPLRLIRHLPQQVVFGPCQVGYLEDQLGPQPVDLPELQRRAKRLSRGAGSASGHLRDLQRLEDARQAPKLLVRDAGAGSLRSAGVVRIVAEQQRADVRSAALRIGLAYDNETPLR
jgi:hypothetical protein